MRKIHFVLSVAAGATLLVMMGCSAARLSEGRKLARASHPFSTAPKDAIATLLIVGDSTGEGTGAGTPENSIAGRLARRFPRLAIENRSEDGARLADVLAQLGTGTQHFDAVLVLAGGNDVIRLTGAESMRTAIEAIARRATAIAPLAILMPAGNVGNAPFFFAPLTWEMTSRSRTLHALVHDAAAAAGADYVNLFKERADDPFVREPERLYARDGLHPSGDGYALWEADLLAQSRLAVVAEGRAP